MLSLSHLHVKRGTPSLQSAASLYLVKAILIANSRFNLSAERTLRIHLTQLYEDANEDAIKAFRGDDTCDNLCVGLG